jgi:D-alanyl-D-alanine carboxypeptidase/D-alanyl-D-alanine-endopeptidase (penicillin-binding protein 4)
MAIIVAVTVLAVVAAGSYLGTRQWRERNDLAERPFGAPAAAVAALAGADAPPPPATAAAPDAPEPAAAQIAAALGGELTDPRLGGRLIGEVADAQTGDVLFDREDSTPASPASTAKLVTAVALLSVRKATDRITTTVRAGTAPGTVVFVGAGDPTLSAAPPGTPTAYPDAARISDLAAQLKTVGVTHVLIDDSLFSGPAISPGWQPEDVPSEYASAITPLMADGGRPSPTATVRSATPDVAAADALATDLGLPPSAVAPVPPGSDPPAPGRVLASVRSATYGELLQQALMASDNVLTEMLGRQVALAEHQPASFLGAAAAIRAVLGDLGVEIGAGMTDASGLAGGDRLAPAALVAVLRLVAGPARPQLHLVVTDLPVAGWAGTLSGRYTSAPASAAAGLVRAKTGTLTGVSTLAGFVPDAAGRLLAFSFVADRVGPTAAGTTAAEAALDVLTASLATCSCG